MNTIIISFCFVFYLNVLFTSLITIEYLNFKKKRIQKLCKKMYRFIKKKKIE